MVYQAGGAQVELIMKLGGRRAPRAARQSALARQSSAPPVTLQSPFHLNPSPAYDYVVTKNNHYIIVDALHLPLHYAAVSLIGSAAKRY